MSSTTVSGTGRIDSLDIVRGVVMMLMAIDHVRVYSGLPAGGTDVGIFFTRWVTHFCAPAFVFFAGTSAFLYGNKTQNIKELSRFLLTRGALLIVLELTVIRFGWTFNFNYSSFTLAGVIWMIGWCMILLALMVRLNTVIIGSTGLLIIFLQQLFSYVPAIIPDALKSTLGGVWEFFYTSGGQPLPGITILYVLIPWIGVMAAGYGFGKILLLDPPRRRRLCLQIGITAFVLFVVIGSWFILSKPAEADAPPFLFQLLNQKKYPASQLFLMMTLGPAIALLPFVERAKGRLAKVFTTFGRVPFFYYLLHIPLIHLSAWLVNLLLVGEINQEWYTSAPFVFIEESSRWSLALLYVVFILDVTILYFACRWYARYKSNHPEKKWLKFI
ncbi:MAG: DUF1624 domain-containing protein [Bacteroidetes bacterium]|nr:DUF1624 domain-containing protein [Bacteroidota bacterium]